jgi:hypothetical protein
MRRLVVAGLVYLTGIAIVLLIKPTIMFQEDGRWKEFGIGRDPSYYTYLPFWLFTIIWSIVAYVIVMLLEDSFLYKSDNERVSADEQIEYKRNVPRVRNNGRRANVTRELAPGYYMLNEGATGRDGVPRYVYLGPESTGDSYDE